jgi:branched-chain amino acid transport system substrate-binding protein
MNRRGMLMTTVAGILATTRSSWALPSAATVVGLSLPLTGGQSEVGQDLLAGYQLALAASDSNLSLEVLDDGGDVARAAVNVKAMAANPRVLAVSGIVGTPHAEACLPVCSQGGLPVVGIRSGASSLRAGQPGIYHYRASFEDELNAVAKLCAGAGYKIMSIMFSKDSFGEGQRDHLIKAFAKYGIAVLPPVGVERGGANMSQATQDCAKLIKTSATASGVVLLLVAKTMVQAAKELRSTHGIVMPLYSMSFTATRSIAAEPIPELEGLGLVVAFPLPRSSGARLSQQFRQDCAKFKKMEILESPTAYEAYFYMSIILASGATSRAALVQKLNAGVSVKDISTRPNSQMVGFEYLQVVRKAAGGSLRA